MNKRPLPLTILCVLGALGCAYAVIILLVPGVWLVPPTARERAAALGAIAVALASLYGLWTMRRWGLILLGAALVARAVIGMVAGQHWLTAALAGPVVVLLVGLVYVGRMT